MSFAQDYHLPYQHFISTENVTAAAHPRDNSSDLNSLDASSQPPNMSVRSCRTYPEGDFRNLDEQSILDVKFDVMVNFLHQQQLLRLWTRQDPGEGVVLKRTKDTFVCSPRQLMDDSHGLFQAVRAMNVRAAITINTRVINLFLSSHTLEFVPLPNGLRLQVIPSIGYLPRCQKHQFAAFVQDQGILVVWDDEPTVLLDRAERLEQMLMRMIWKGEQPLGDPEKQFEKTSGGAHEKTYEVNEYGVDADELEGAVVAEERPIRLWNAVMTGIMLAMLITALGTGWRSIGLEMVTDRDWKRMALLLVTPVQIFVAFFFFQTIVGNIFQMIGPIDQVRTNSKYYSGKAPKRLNRNIHTLPHVTFQMPVYKEGLAGVIKPTILSLKAAISTYELQGGTANIFVNDDGMQLLNDGQARARREFYEEHAIGWVARPPHQPDAKGGEKSFVRKGKFKKASNMNYGLAVSNLVEDKLNLLYRHEAWTQKDEAAAYATCLEQVLDESDGEVWADGNIRIGDYILLIDSDTRVPLDCLLDATSEMEQSPEVAILQFTSGVMKVTTSFFESGVTFFTNLIYTAIRYAVANGDVSPFVGHNAILRWAAIQEVSFVDEEGIERYWSESHVSEDFDMALRLQVAGFTIRFAGYTGDGFKEGVSLTVYDELSRWEKYAYGCNELIFHPLKYWLTRGPFTPLFRKFIGSNVPFPSKLTILAYIGTYYAIASSWLLTLANYFIMGWWRSIISTYYLDSFSIFFSVIVVFMGCGNIALATFRYRLSERTLFSAFGEVILWLPLWAIFMGGLSLHLSQALLCHFFGIDMSWGATKKELEDTTFFEEMPKLLRRFKGVGAFVIIGTLILVAGVYWFPVLWRIDVVVAIAPIAWVIVAHFLLPIVLNPGLMRFSF